MAEAFTMEMLAADAHRHAINEIASLLDGLGHDPYLDAMDDEEMTDRWVRKWLLEPLEWDSSRRIEYDRDDAITVSGRRIAPPGDPVRRLFLPVVPKESNPRVLTLRPEQGWVQRGPSLAPAAAYDRREAIILLRGTKTDLQNLRATANTIIGLINEDVTNYFRDFRPTVLRMVQGQRANLTREDEQFRAEARDLGVEIRQRSEAPALVDVRERTEVRVLREPPPRRGAASDPYLHPDSIEKIVNLIDRAGRGFEVARKEFRKLGEEGLRHVIVGYLNAVFDSTDVTGETFSKDGKPDLVIMRGGRPVLVGECKFWDGQALYKDTIGKQLVRYILWRQTNAVLITFATRQNLSRVVREAQEATNDHPSVLGTIKERSETYFVSSHVHPDDSEKRMEAHHLLFNLHSTP